MIGDKAREVLIESMSDKPLSAPARLAFSINADPEDFVKHKVQNIIYIDNERTLLKYKIFYSTNKEDKTQLKGEYIFTKSGACRQKRTFIFSDYAELKKKSKESPELKFFLKFSNLNEELLQVAKANYGATFTIVINYVKYNKEIVKKLKKKFPDVPEEEIASMPLLMRFEDSIALRQYDMDKYLQRRNLNANTKQIYRKESTQYSRDSSNGANASGRGATYFHK